MKKRKVLICLSVLVTIIFVAKTLWKAQPSTVANQENTTEKIVTSDENQSECTAEIQVDETPNPKTYVIENLVKHGWTRPAAESVYRINEEYYWDLGELDLKDLDHDLGNLYRLSSPEIQTTLVKHPNYATLLSSVLDVDPNGALKIARTIPMDEAAETIIADLYAVTAVPEDSAEMAAVLQNPQWRNRIIQLIQKSPTYMNVVTYFKQLRDLQNENPQAAKVYEDWLMRILNELQSVKSGSLRATDLDIFLTIHSPFIIEDLKKDSGFRAAFPECWRKFERLLGSLNQSDEKYEQLTECYYQDTDVFRFLYEYRNEHAVELYKKYGATATAIFMSPTFLEPEARQAREKLEQLLLTTNSTGDCQAILASEPQNFPSIRKLLTKGLPDNYYIMMFRQLAAEKINGNESRLINYWTSLSDSALKKELGLHDPGMKQFIPGYDVFCLCEKSLQGRDVSGWDVAFAGVDAAFMVVDVMTLGGSKAVTSTVSTASKGVKVAAKGTGHLIKSCVKISAKEAKSSALLTIRAIKQAKQFLASQTAHLAKGIDISPLVRYSFEKSGLGAKTFKKWTGFEAHSFMRGDRKVIMHLERIPSTRSGKIARNVLCDMAAGCGLVLALETDTGQQILEEGKDFVDNPKETRLRWQKNLSMWWRLNQHS